jgi:catechol 2,3-dioxygenase-like lactoylglutathione lyase family enzyme
MMTNATPPDAELFVTQFLVVSDQDRSRDCCQNVLGADVVRNRDPVILTLANTRLVLNVGAGPTDDKPTVRLASPADPDVSSGFLNLRVQDIAKAHRDWSARGATFLTEPKDHGYEIRAYIRDPDGHLIEAGQTA